MTQKYKYGLFPETPKSRVLLAIAFIGGLALIAVFVWVQVRVISQLGESAYVCDATEDLDCLQAQDDLAAGAGDTCLGTGNHFCLVPLGQVSPGVVKDLVDYYNEEYGLRGVSSSQSAYHRPC